MDKKLRIKVSTVKRLHNDLKMYEQEVVDENNRIDKMKEDGKDEYDIKKAKEVLGESEMMVPDTKRRIQTAKDDLEQFMVCFLSIPLISCFFFFFLIG